MFEDISASAIMVGGITDWAEKDVARQTLNNSVADSTFRNLPQEFHGADSVSVFIAANTTLEHNFFGGSSYSAVSLGWGWHTILGNTSYARANRVIFNDIRDSMQLLFDGGSLYTLGSQPSSEAAYNLIRGLGSCVKTNAIYHVSSVGACDLWCAIEIRRCVCTRAFGAIMCERTMGAPDGATITTSCR